MFIKTKTWITVGLFFSSISLVNSQNPISITKNSTDGGNKTYVAQDNIKFLDGYNYLDNTHKLHAYIDKQTAYSTLFTNASFASVNSNTGLTVGKTEGMQSVSETGAGVYSVPIALPAGTNKLMPELALSYSSQQGNGVLGIGWGMQGLSEINLVPSSWYHDDETENVEIDGHDKFALDGQRLFATNGTYGSNGTAYSTEVETYIKVTSYGFTGVPTWFKVETKAGLTMEFGRTDDAKFKRHDGVNISWKINKIYDSHGNYIKFEYFNEDNECRIDRILYTGNESMGVDPYNVIKFRYSTRQDKNTYYVAGATIKTNHILDKIEIHADGEHYKDYEFDYGLNHYSFLSTITEVGAGGENLNSTIFQYGNKGLDFQSLSCGTFSGMSADFKVSRDFNADGKSDILVSHFYYNSSGTKVQTTWEIFVATTANTFTHYADGSIPLGYFMFFDSNVDDIKIHGLTSSLDYYGDGADDILLIKINGGASGLYLSSFKIIDINGVDNTSSYTLPNSPGGNIVLNKSFHIGDFDGDGRDDILLMKLNTSNSTYFGKLYTVHSGVTNINEAGLEWLASAIKILPSDFDGDGKKELMVIYPNSCEIFELSSQPVGGNYQVEKIYHSGNPGYPTDWHKIIPGDFNGDGKTDILTSGDDVNWNIGYSDGKTFHEYPFTFNAPYNSSSSAHGLKIGDFNGDGKTDILHSYNVYSGSVSTQSKLDLYYSKGSSFNYVSHTTGVISSHNDFALGDFNGDGKYEVFNRDLYSAPASIYYFNRNGKDFLLHKVKDGYNRETTMNYDWLTKGNLYNNSGNSTIYNHELPKALPVISNVITPDGIGGNTTVSYQYEGAKWNTQGKGFLGFTKIIAINSNSGFTTVAENELMTIPSVPGGYILLKKKELSRLTSTGATISQKTFSNVITSLDDVRIKAIVTSTAQDDYINNVSVTNNFSYDVFGNVTGLNTTKGPETTVTINAYGSYGSWWIPSRLTSKTTTSYKSGETPISRTTSYIYNSKGFIYKETNDPSKTKAVVSHYFYDLFGNVKQTILTGGGVGSRMSKRTYDGKGRFAIEYENQLGQITATVFDKKWGKPIHVTDISGLTKSYVYDGFGTLINATDQKGNVTILQRQWHMTEIYTPVGPLTTLYKEVGIYPGKPDQTKWFDLFEREIIAETESASSGIFVSNSFDSQGRLHKSTSPYFTGDSPIVSSHNYDQYGRPVSMSNGVSTTTYAYSVSGSNRTIAITNPAQSTSQTFDGAGRVISSSDQAGTLNFVYYSNGQKKSVSMSGNILEQLFYDEYGRQEKLIDLNAGETKYEYNAFGELIYQKDANNVEYFVDLDALGRETLKTGPEGTYTTTYVSNGNGINKTEKIVGPNGVTIEYEYDMYGRILTDVETVGSEVFNTSFQYDNTDNIIAITYPSGFKAKFVFDTKSNLLKVTDNSGLIKVFTDPTQNARGQYTGYTLGDGILTTKAYDNYGFLTDIDAPGVQDYNLAFNPINGNLHYRQDFIKDRKEFFQYDGSNRLIESKVGYISNPLLVTVPIDIDYTSNGNVSTKSHIGSYTYDANKINAVVGVSNPLGNLSLMTQNLTYAPFDRVESISDGDYHIDLSYGPDLNRVKTELYDSGSLMKTKYFLGMYEKEVTPSGIKEIHHIPTGDGNHATYIIDGGVASYYYLYKDHINSVVAVTNNTGAVVYEQNFDAWGKRRNALNWTTYTTTPVPAPFTWVRGFTGHEHLDEVNLINMNNRVYDPAIARMLATDNFVQDLYTTQGYNRYTYALNNPLSYTDPSGEIAVAPFIIGAAVGMYMGGTLANNTANPFEWNYNSGKTWGYMLGGAVVGGISGGVGSAISSTTIAFANTQAIMFSSLWYSVGTAIYTGGATDVSMNFGFASYNFSQNEFGYLFKKGNSKGENLGYAFGAIANISDVLAGMNPGEVQMVRAEAKIIEGDVGHIAITEVGETDNTKSIISFGPGDEPNGKGLLNPISRFEPNAEWPNHLTDRMPVAKPIIVQGVNVNRLEKYGGWTNNFKYNVYYSSCVNHAARGLTLSGVPVIGITPKILSFQISLRAMGIRPSMFTYYYTK